MLLQLVSYIMKNGKGVIATGAISASGIIILILGLNTVTNAKIDNGISGQKAYMREYVALSIKPIKVELKNIQKNQIEIKSLIKDIHKHLFKN